MKRLLETRSLTAGYGDFQALYGIDFHVDDGEAVAIIGANGAGKTTFLRTLAGQLRATGGQLRFADENIAAWPGHRMAEAGIALVPEGRRLFPSLSVEENLLMGAYTRRPGPWTLASVFELFPVLCEFRRRPATELSGGQQQMVAIARGLAADPKILAVDEPCLGLAEAIAKRVYDVLGQIHADGTTLIVVEEAPRRALTLCNRRVEVRNGMAAAA